MKKTLLIGLLFVAVGAFAQQLTPLPTPQTGGNKATLHQDGMMLIGVIDQTGYQNVAKIVQEKGDGLASMMNTAIIKQVGLNNEANITQWNMGNYAFLLQGTDKDPVHTAKGNIVQSGWFNVAAVKQLDNSTVNITQSGKYNAVLGLVAREAVNFCYPGVPAPYNFTCDPATYPYQPYTPLLVGKGQTYEIVQAGQGNFFYGIGELLGTRTIHQTSIAGIHGKAYKAPWDFKAKNYIFLEQKAGDVTLDQTGVENKIWLSVNKLKGAAGDPKVQITQYGHDNQVARFSSACPGCQNVAGPAVFMGDEMVVNQNGIGNKLSVDSQSKNSSVYVDQKGFFNAGLIVQRDFYYYKDNHEGGCHGCH